MIEIRHRITGEILISGEYGSIKEAAEKNKDKLQGADLQGADLQNAKLRKANLKGANLRGANFSETDLRGADLRGADLENTYLHGTLLQKTILDFRVLDIKGSVHPVRFIALFNDVYVGCKKLKLKEWIVDYDELLHKQRYTEDQIDEYKKYFVMCKIFRSGRLKNV